MKSLIQIFIFIPLLGFIVSLFFSNKQEKLIAATAYTIVGIQFITIVLYTAYWLIQHTPTLNLKHFVFYKEGNIEIFLDYYFDKSTAVFSILGAFITFLVLVFSKYYLHRDEGYKRFFNTVLLFYFAYNLTVFSGNFETLFIGWEFLGITSFLLVAFYRDRYLPVKNALKTISLYRLGDICLILALWTSHHIWHKNITFIQLDDVQIVVAHIHENFYSVLFLLSMILIAASIKSAQFPFSSWLPRAMEGPTTSSAVFYGSLSVHLGVFLLLRTFHYWESILIIKILVILIGILTAIIASLIARVQSTVKTQIAYAAIAQIGLMFIEVAMGWHTLLLFHLCGNALLRTYQLLVSPSVLGYMIHDQFFNYSPKVYQTSNTFLNKLSNSIYTLSIKEWNLDGFLKKTFWNPFKMIGRSLHIISSFYGILSLVIIFTIGLCFFVLDRHMPLILDKYLHLLYAFLGMIIILIAFAEKKNPIYAWLLIILSQAYIVLSIALLNDQYEYLEILIYVTSLVIAAALGILILLKLKKAENKLDLNDFYGYAYDHPKLAFWFLLSSLAFVGLPFTPSFIGVDLMFSHIDHDEYLLTFFTAISFLVLELTVLRIYARLFLGPNKKQTHPIAYRSS
jgi:NADH:ubiquinone oxidoreductase subunit 5 (subunit L)/multisubunit Na+/H+ antiporter MnhA subunit